MVSAENDPRRAGTIWLFDIDQSIPVVRPFLEASFSRVGPESIATLASAMGPDSSAEITRRFEAGRKCYVAEVESKIVAYGWVSFIDEFIGELNPLLKLLPGEAYIWNCATLPAFQGNHLYSALLTYILADLSNGKFKRVWIGANLDNIASQRGIAHAGFRHIADLVVARV